MTGQPLSTFTGGTPSVVALVVVGQVVTAALATWIAVRTYRGYQQADDAALLWLAVGVALLSVGATTVEFLLPSFGGAPVMTTLVARSSELSGLFAILYAIYGIPRRRRQP
ncbi:hypothetical protein [Halostella sp. PRR32]|uniref:DUF7521 family protein n=1 Tax=Halostella sp. PRR32 TaxID=3098147 RepID=UPI002B1D5969|nr:hypothetical protein [Halostella sp. PRR32]